MRCLVSSLAVFLGSAVAFTPLERRQQDERSWTPAKETGRSEGEERLGWSPKPTDAPIPPPRYGEMDLLKRADFTLGTDTCGFVSGFSSAAVTCVRQSAYCTNDGVGNMDCCTGEYSLCTSSMFSSCLDYSASSRGACSGKGPRTICCWAESPSCYTLIYSTTASPGKVFSILQCQASGGLDTLLATPPNLSASTPTRSSSSSSSSTTGTSSTSTTPPGGGTGGGTTETTTSSSTPVGAIVGGVVGGFAAIGLMIFLIFWLMIRSRNNSSNKSSNAAAAALPPTTTNPDMSQMAQTPQTAGFVSPGGYSQYTPSGQNVATDFKPFPDSAALQQQQQQGGGYPPQQQQQQPGYGPPSAGYGGGYPPGGTPSSGYPPQSGSVSPGFPNQGFPNQQMQMQPQMQPQPQYGQGGPYPGHPGQGMNELPGHYPPGSEGHRVELG